MHGPVMHAVYFIMEPVFRMNGGKDGAWFWGYHFQCFAGLLFTGVPMVWVSDVFEICRSAERRFCNMAQSKMY